MKFLSRFEPNAYFVLRVIFGFLFMCHGLQKVFGMIGGIQGHPAPTMSVPWVGGVIELVTGVLILIGFLTHIAGFLASGEMAFAYFMVHFPHGFFPIKNGGELAVIYCFVALYIACRGAGRFGVDRS
jgi:putative oxidoreductase